MPASAARRLEWAPSALQAYIDSLAHISDEDPRTAELVRERVEHALDLILEHPGMGVPTARRGERRYPIANTGQATRTATHRSIATFAHPGLYAGTKPAPDLIPA